MEPDSGSPLWTQFADGASAYGSTSSLSTPMLNDEVAASTSTVRGTSPSEETLMVTSPAAGEKLSAAPPLHEENFLAGPLSEPLSAEPEALPLSAEVLPPAPEEALPLSTEALPLAEEAEVLSEEALTLAEEIPLAEEALPSAAPAAAEVLSSAPLLEVETISSPPPTEEANPLFAVTPGPPKEQTLVPYVPPATATPISVDADEAEAMARAGEVLATAKAAMRGPAQSLSADASAPRICIRERHRFSHTDISTLEYHFQRDPFPPKALRVELGESLGTSARVIQIWFQNRRQKWRAHHLKDSLNSGEGPEPLHHRHAGKNAKARIGDATYFRPSAGSPDTASIRTDMVPVAPPIMQELGFSPHPETPSLAIASPPALGPTHALAPPHAAAAAIENANSDELRTLAHELHEQLQELKNQHAQAEAQMQQLRAQPPEQMFLGCSPRNSFGWIDGGNQQAPPLQLNNAWAGGGAMQPFLQYQPAQLPNHWLSASCSSRAHPGASVGAQFMTPQQGYWPECSSMAGMAPRPPAQPYAAVTGSSPAAPQQYVMAPQPLPASFGAHVDFMPPVEPHSIVQHERSAWGVVGTPLAAPINANPQYINSCPTLGRLVP